jgi:DNA-binding transcriptional LysR family regulator
MHVDAHWRRLGARPWPSASLECLENGEADIAIVGQFESETRSAFAPTRLTTYPFVLLALASYSLLNAPRVAIKQLAREPLVLPNASANTRARLDKLFHDAGMLDELNVAVDASNFELLVVYAISGFGISVLPVSPMFLRQVARRDRSLPQPLGSRWRLTVEKNALNKWTRQPNIAAVGNVSVSPSCSSAACSIRPKNSSHLSTGTGM